jgi:hypothetical protein
MKDVTLTGASCHPGQLAYSTTYTRQITAQDERGSTATGLTWRFKTEVEPQPPSYSNLIVNGGFEGYDGWTNGVNK